MKIKLFLAFLLVKFAAAAQYTLIPDINFEKRLIALNMDSGTPDGKVLTAKISSLKILDVGDRSITDLTGIQAFTALTDLDCHLNQLTSLNLSGLTALQTLHCSYNLLTSLNLSGLTALKTLNCPYNKLTSLNLSGLTALQIVHFQGNSVTSINLNGLPALTDVDCYGNQLTSLNLSDLPVLQNLVCNENLLTSLDLSKVSTLQSLSCIANKLTSINLSGLTALVQFSCAANPLTTLNLKGLDALNSLFCNADKLTTLDVSGNLNLHELYCTSNNMTSLNIKNTKLTTMDFKDNPNLCIQLDDKTYADANWYLYKDATASYANVCSALGTEEIVFAKMSIYPNPTKGELHIDNVTLEKATVYDPSGKLVKSICFDNASDKNTLNLNGLDKGIYYLFIESEGAHTAEKIVIE